MRPALYRVGDEGRGAGRTDARGEAVKAYSISFALTFAATYALAFGRADAVWLAVGMALVFVSAHRVAWWVVLADRRSEEEYLRRREQQRQADRELLGMPK